MRKSQESFHSKKERIINGKSQAASSKQRTNRQANTRYLSVGFNNEIVNDYNSTTNHNCIYSGGLSTNEDTYNSNGAFKKSDESSACNSSELQMTKLSNELPEKEQQLVQLAGRSNRIGDINDKRK